MLRENMLNYSMGDRRRAGNIRTAEHSLPGGLSIDIDSQNMGVVPPDDAIFNPLTSQM